MKVGSEVIVIKPHWWNRPKYGVDLMDGHIGIFSNREHAEQFIAQQNTVLYWSKKTGE